VGARDRSITAVERNARPIELQISAFEGQRKGSELATSAHYLVPHEDPVWRQTGSGATKVDAPGVAPTVRTATLLGPSGRFLVWQWYVMDGIATVSDAEVKLRVAAAAVAARSDRGYWVALLAPYANDPAEADRSLREFVQQAGPSLASTLGMRQ
ncbi:MAG: exosortase C-terminal domain/associated protein EpsI, partial [Burkholderiaceae bacterium]